MIKLTIFTGCLVIGVAVGISGTLLLKSQAQARIDQRTAIVTQLRQQATLSTAVFTIDVTVPIEQAATLAGFEYGKTKLLYVAQVEVDAGYDLSKATVGDDLAIGLPAAEILTTRINPSTSKVQSYDRGFLALGPDVAPDLLIQAQQAAIQQAIGAACKQQITKSAQEFAPAALKNVVGDRALDIAESSGCSRRQP